MQCWMNGSYMAAEDLRISPFDHGFYMVWASLKRSEHMKGRYLNGMHI